MSPLLHLLRAEHDTDTPTVRGDTYRVLGPKRLRLTSLMTHLSALSGTLEWVNNDSSYISTALTSVPVRTGGVVKARGAGVTTVSFTEARETFTFTLRMKGNIHSKP